MATKIAARSAEPFRPLPANDLRRAFDTAVSELRESDPTAKKGLWYRTPIFQRRDILGISQANPKERALKDAARALAQLWRV
jgi:hypothetical protein